MISTNENKNEFLHLYMSMLSFSWNLFCKIKYNNRIHFFLTCIYNSAIFFF